MSDHIPARPNWDCRACGRAWPCASAREALADEYAGRHTALTVYLAACFVEALEDLTARGETPPADLHERLMGWVAAAAPASPDE